MCQSVSVEWFSTCSESRFWFTLIGVGWLGFLFCGLKHVMVERLKLVLVDVVIVNDFWSSRVCPGVFRLHQLPCWAGENFWRQFWKMINDI